jgi:hypothetical protein
VKTLLTLPASEVYKSGDRGLESCNEPEMSDEMNNKCDNYRKRQVKSNVFLNVMAYILPTFLYSPIFNNIKPAKCALDGDIVLNEYISQMCKCTDWSAHSWIHQSIASKLE